MVPPITDKVKALGLVQSFVTSFKSLALKGLLLDDHRVIQVSQRHIYLSWARI